MVGEVKRVIRNIAIIREGYNEVLRYERRFYGYRKPHGVAKIHIFVSRTRGNSVAEYRIISVGNILLAHVPKYCGCLANAMHPDHWILYFDNAKHWSFME